ncbi:MAG TPA: hypothetical protein VGI75_09850, partial [Pirellulales bacterium]
MARWNRQTVGGRSSRTGHHRRGRLQPNRWLGRNLSIEQLEPRIVLAAAYTWQDAAIGAGGFLDGVFFDPNQSGVMYARTDIGGLYKTSDGGNHWKPLLDFVGNSTSSSGNGTQGG